MATSYLKVRLWVLSVADPVHTMVALRSPAQSQVPLMDILTPSQSHVTDQQQPGSICLTGFGVFQTGSVDRKHEKDLWVLNATETPEQLTHPNVWSFRCFPCLTSCKEFT